MLLDLRIADVPYASENSAQEPEQTNIIHLPAEQGPPIEGAGSAGPKILPGTPTLAEIREFNKINGIVDPILDLSAEDIADLAEKMPDKFNLEQSLLKYQPHWDKELIDKSAEAYNLLERRGWKPAKDLGLSKLPGMAKEAVVGGASWLASLAKGAVGIPAALAMEKIDSMMGIPPSEPKTRHAMQREISENAAATEASVTGLAFLGEKAYNKVFGKKPELKTHEEKIASLKAALIPHLAQQKISEGGGIIQPSPEVQAELTQAGMPVRPEEVQKKIAGDPVGFVLFGKGLEGVSGLMGLTKATAKAAAKLPGIAPVVEKVSATVGPAAKKVVDFIPSPGEVAGGAARAAGATISGTAKVVEKAAPIGVPLVSAFTGGSVLSNIGHAVGAIGGGAAGAALVKPIVLGAQIAGKIGKGLGTFGREIAGKELPTGALTQGVKDVLQSIPDAAGHVGRGAALDLGLAAVTSTTPEDQQGLQLGTILGAAQAARGTAAWIVSGQKIAPRPWGSKTSVASSKQLPIFDAMHNAAYSKATPAVREHVNAVREFLKGVGSDADVFLADPTHVRTADDGRVVNTDIEKALLDSGYDPAYAELAGKQSGFFEKQMPGKDGQQRRAIVLADADAAPHEAKHAFQDVLGEQANQVIDKVIREHYGDEWEQIGQNYTEKLLGRKLASDESWRDILLDASGDGNIWAKRRLELDQANQFTTETGAAPKEGQFPELPKLEPGQWRNVLSAEEAGQAADRYLSREIAAENFDAIFKNLGASLKEKTGVLPWLARVVASTTEMLGGDALRGRQSNLGMPLKEPVIEAIKGQARGELPEVTPRAETPRPTRPITLPSGAPAPVTPADREAVAAETRAIAENASNVPKAAGLRSDRELLGEIALAQATGGAVKLNYLSAPEEPAAAISSNRSIRRQMIEIFRNMPQAARRLWEKNFFPERVRQTKKGKIQVGGWAPEVFAANAHKTAQALSRLDPSLSPYPIDPATKSFTEDGWKQLFEDTQKFVQNQMAGRTGSGEELVVPKGVIDAGFFKPPLEAGAGGLDQRKADFISAMFGMKLPETARMQSGKMPLNLAGQQVSEATIPGRVTPPVRPRGEYGKPFEGQEVQEVNKWRKEFEQAAKTDFPSLIEAFQWLNLENIKEVQHTPEQPQFRGNTLTLQAGFRPKETQFRPTEKKEIEAIGPDGKSYKVRFDGYWDLRSLGKGQVPAITALEDIPGSLTKFSSGMSKSLEDAGYKLVGIPEPESTAQFKPKSENEEGVITRPPWTAARISEGPSAQFSPKIRNPEAERLAEEYVKTLGLPKPVSTKDRPLPMDLLKQAADELEDTPHAPDDPAVKAGYTRMLEEIMKQGQLILDSGVDVEPWPGEGEPYKNSQDMLSDVTKNKHLYFLPTDTAFGAEGGLAAAAPEIQKNLLTEPSGMVLHGRELNVNEVLRFVHDFFGHGPEGTGFGPRGEFNALLTHLQMFPEEAKAALLSELFMQSSWYFANRKLRRPDGSVPVKGDPDFIPFGDPRRQFADPKNLLPSKNLMEKLENELNQVRESGAQFKPKKGKKQDDLKFVPTSFGAASKAWILPNGKVEQLGAEWHHQWLDENPDIQKKYGLKIPPFEGTDTEGVREQAMKKGFARVNLDGATLVVEAREKDWKHLRPIVEDLIERNLDDIDKFRVQLLNDAVNKITRSFADKLFDADSDKEKLGRVFDAFSETPQAEIGRETQFKPSNEGEDIQGAIGHVYPRSLDVVGRKGRLSSLSHTKLPREDAGQPISWRYSDKYNTVFWWERPNADQKQAVNDWLKDKGFDPQAHEYMHPGMTKEFYDTAHGQFKPKQSDFEDPETLKETLSEPGWAIVTATQESQGPWNDPKNIAANKKLATDLKSMGYEYFPVSGTYKGEPQGENFVVLGISPTDAQTLGRKYGQESVLINRGLLYGDGTITPARPEDTITGPKAAEEDFYSTTPEGLDFSIPLDFNKPYQAVGEQSQLFGGREYVSPAQLSRQELLDRYPEAIVPKNSNEKIPSDVVGSPLYKKSENPVRAFADRLVEFAKQHTDNPVYQLGLRWYSDFVPLLKKHFGADAPMMAELLAASSPNETPTQNFFYAVDALEGFKSGRFDKIIDKFNQGFEMFKQDKWLSWYNKELKAGNVQNPPANPTPEAFLAHWIYKHGLKPKQSNGALYGFHGKAILEVMARKWLEQNKGPKVANFVQNLLGIGHEATIDVWADRTMRRIGYEGAKDRWRILPKNGEGVSDADFEFAQKAFREAAKDLGITPDALQGGLWFAEKKLWADNGWGRLDLGSYVNEIENLAIIRKSIKQRLKTTELKKKAVPMEQSGLDFDVEPRKLK